MAVINQHPMGFFETLFPASKSAILAKGAAVAGGTGPVRMKKGPNIIQSIMGVFIGILLVLGSPVAMWYAQSQHTAKDFQSATSVEATSGASGYVKFSGAPSYADPSGGADCFAGDCVWQTESQQELITETDLVCGSNVRSTETMRVLQQNGSECDENGDCVPCYDVERDTWKEQSSTESIYNLTVGSYTIVPDGAIMFDTEEKIVDTGYNEDTLNDTRTVYTYFPLPSTIVVAGDSDGTRVSDGELAFVLSEHNEATTLEKLKARDKSNMLILFVVTFFMLFIGISLILGPLQWMGRQLRFVPVFGPMLSKGSSAIIGLVSLLIAIPLWILIWVFVVLLKLWWLALIVILALVGFIVWKAMKGKNAAPAAPAPPANPAV